MKKRYDVYFNDDYDVDGVDEICDSFSEAQQWYGEKRVRFYGLPERLEEFKRAVTLVAKIRKIITL